ncbi:MAG: hypothetical protein ACRER2_07590 [Methylococcales bacterium]
MNVEITFTTLIPAGLFHGTEAVRFRSVPPGGLVALFATKPMGQSPSREIGRSGFGVGAGAWDFLAAGGLDRSSIAGPMKKGALRAFCFEMEGQVRVSTNPDIMGRCYGVEHRRAEGSFKATEAVRSVACGTGPAGIYTRRGWISAFGPGDWCKCKSLSDQHRPNKSLQHGSLDGACGIQDFEAPMLPYSVALHTGYSLIRKATDALIDKLGIAGYPFSHYQVSKPPGIRRKTQIWQSGIREVICYCPSKVAWMELAESGISTLQCSPVFRYTAYGLLAC